MARATTARDRATTRSGPPPAITERGLNRATLARQLLLRREPIGVAEGMRRVVALQAQEAASPYIALWSRLSGFDPAELDRAFADGSVVKATMMRVTLHAALADDYRAFHDAMQPTLRAARMNDRRFTRTGLTTDDAHGHLADLRRFAAEPRTNAEVESWLDERLGVLPKPGVWWALRQSGPFVHAVTGGPWSFGARPSYRAAPGWSSFGDPDAGLRQLVARYLAGFGPASVPDIGQFALIQRPRIRAALAGLGDHVRSVDGPGGSQLYDVADGSLPDDDTPAPPRLMAMWDSVMLAYADRSRIVPPDLRRLVIRPNGDVLPTLLVDGYVAGVWRTTDDGIEATAFHPLSDDAWEGLEGEAATLVAFLAGREPRVYRRYDRWWTSLPPGETRILR